MKSLSIRDMTPDDFLIQDEYFKSASDDYLQRLGIDASVLRAEAAPDLAAFSARMALPTLDKVSHSFAVCVDGKLVGNVTFKQIKFGESCDVHGHIYSSANRASGIGSEAIVEALDRVFKRFELRLIYAEPSVGNPAPNALLQSLGLFITSTYDTPAGGILLPRTVNRYEITRDWFYKTLRS